MKLGERIAVNRICDATAVEPTTCSWDIGRPHPPRACVARLRLSRVRCGVRCDPGHGRPGAAPGSPAGRADAAHPGTSPTRRRAARTATPPASPAGRGFA